MTRTSRLKVWRSAGALALAMAMLTAGCAETDTGGVGNDRRERVSVDRQSEPGGNGPDGRSSRESGAQKAEPSTGSRSRGGNLASTLLTRLRVSAEVVAGYDRDLFYHWADLGACDVRELVLARQDRRDGRCGSESGRWFSVYDGVTTTDPGDFDVDHMVPLAEAWASGARGWPKARRDDFANDLGSYSLIAVSASSNRSKSDRDPAEWMPDNENFACPYVARWIAVKFRWRLSVDGREEAFLKNALSACPPAALRLKAEVGRRR